MERADRRRLGVVEPEEDRAAAEWAAVPSLAPVPRRYLVKITPEKISGAAPARRDPGLNPAAPAKAAPARPLGAAASRPGALQGAGQDLNLGR